MMPSAKSGTMGEKRRTEKKWEFTLERNVYKWRKWTEIVEWGHFQNEISNSCTISAELKNLQKLDYNSLLFASSLYFLKCSLAWKEPFSAISILKHPKKKFPVYLSSSQPKTLSNDYLQLAERNFWPTWDRERTKDYLPGIQDEIIGKSRIFW